MRDPHVLSLTYSVEVEDTASFEDAPPLHATLDGFRVRLQDKKLEIEPTQHFSDVGVARAAIDPLLRSWEVDVALRFGSAELSFRFETARVVDRNPIPGELEPVQLGASATVQASSRASLRVPRAKYPDPPTRFRISPDVETLWHRYSGYKQGREPLPAMAYFCLTFLEALAKGRGNAAKRFKISPQVLSKLGQLSSTRGDGATARKYIALASGGPLSDTEVAWTEKAVQTIIRRLGEDGDINSLSTITLDDLPRL